MSLFILHVCEGLNSTPAKADRRHFDIKQGRMMWTMCGNIWPESQPEYSRTRMKPCERVFDYIIYVQIKYDKLKIFFRVRFLSPYHTRTCTPSVSSPCNRSPPRHLPESSFRLSTSMRIQLDSICLQIHNNYRSRMFLAVSRVFTFDAVSLDNDPTIKEEFVLPRKSIENKRIKSNDENSME